MSDFLPVELVNEILLKLPPKQLVKCLSVSKNWYSIITSTSFISTHLSRALSSPPSLFLRYFTQPPKSQLFSPNFDPSFHLSHNPFPSPFEAKFNLFFRIVGSIHGLICLSDDLFTIDDTIMIWNPSINRYVSLPKPNANTRVVGPHFSVIGFGYDPKFDDYKVVRLFYAKRGESIVLLPPRIEIYSLKDKFWREINASRVIYYICERGWSQCFMNGCVHWVAYERKSRIIENFILIFDICNEKFKRMELPESLVHVMPITLRVVEIEGSLAVLHYDFREDGFHYYPGSNENWGGGDRYCDVWVRKEYEVANSWAKVYSIFVEGGVESVLSLRPSGEFLVATRYGKLISYDPKSLEMKDLGIEGIKEAFYVQNYTESLVLLDKESAAASYGGVKDGCKKQEGTGKSASTVSEFEEETASILALEDGNAEPETTPARLTLSFGIVILQRGFGLLRV